MNLNEWLQAHVKSGRRVDCAQIQDPPDFFWVARLPAPLIECRDGFTMSVQASAGHYCLPRNNEGPYTHFEIWLGYDPLFEPWHIREDEPMGNVPLDVVLAVIEKHGGLARS